MVAAGAAGGAPYGARSYLSKQRAPVAHAAHRWVEWDRRLLAKPAFQWAARAFPERQIAARGLTTLDVHALVRAGVGLGALPRVVGDADPELTRVVDVPDELASSIWLLTHAELRNLPRIRVVMGALRRVLKQQKARL